MKSFIRAAALIAGLLAPSVVLAAPPVTTGQRDLLQLVEVREDSAVETRGLEKRAPTCNTPSNRACWTNGFDINTDYETNIPFTGSTKAVSLAQMFFKLRFRRTWSLTDDNSTCSLSRRRRTGSAQMAF